MTIISFDSIMADYWLFLLPCWWPTWSTVTKYGEINRNQLQRVPCADLMNVCIHRAPDEVGIIASTDVGRFVSEYEDKRFEYDGPRSNRWLRPCRQFRANLDGWLEVCQVKFEWFIRYPLREHSWGHPPNLLILHVTNYYNTRTVSQVNDWYLTIVYSQIGI